MTTTFARTPSFKAHLAATRRERFRDGRHIDVQSTGRRAGGGLAKVCASKPDSSVERAVAVGRRLRVGARGTRRTLTAVPSLVKALQHSDTGARQWVT
jgi:hypothetical protein